MLRLNVSAALKSVTGNSRRSTSAFNDLRNAKRLLRLLKDTPRTVEKTSILQLLILDSHFSLPITKLFLANRSRELR